MTVHYSCSRIIKQLISADSSDCSISLKLCSTWLVNLEVGKLGTKTTEILNIYSVMFVHAAATHYSVVLLYNTKLENKSKLQSNGVISSFPSF